MVDVVLRVDLSILGKGNNMRRICIISLLMIMIPVGFADVFEGATLDPEILSQIMIDPSTSQQEQSSFFDTYQPAEDNWLVEQIRYFEPGYGQTANSAPFINLAGYLDTDLSWEAGGQFTMLAYVTDIDSPVVSVEVYWDGQPTGLFLEDDGLHVKKFFNIGMAVGLDHALIVPVVKHCEQKSLLEIARAMKDLGDKARSESLQLDEISGGTISITNAGGLGALSSTPIIVKPQVAILGVHKIVDKPVVRDGEIVIRPIMNFGMSFDHRVIDGAYAVQFLRRMIEYLEDPDLWLLDMV